VPYRVDAAAAASGTLERLIDLGALDVEAEGTGLAALMPDSVTSSQLSSRARRRQVLDVAGRRPR